MSIEDATTSAVWMGTDGLDEAVVRLDLESVGGEWDRVFGPLPDPLCSGTTRPVFPLPAPRDRWRWNLNEQMAYSERLARWTGDQSQPKPARP